MIPQPGERRVYELRFEKESGEGWLMRSNCVGDSEMISSMLRSPSQATSAHPLELTWRDETRERTVRAHQAILGCLYHVAPTFGIELVQDTRQAIVAFANLTQYYDCSQVTKMHIRDFLCARRDQVLSFELGMVHMLELGVKAEADWIVKECAAYIICQERWSYNSSKSAMIRKGASMTGVLELINEKRRVALEELRAVDSKLLYLHSRTVGVASRLASAYFQLCMGMVRSNVKPWSRYYASFYRQIFAVEGRFALTKMRLEAAFGKITKDCSGTKVDYDDIEVYWNYTLMEQAKAIVAPVLKDVTVRKSATTETTALRFMTIADDELPWKANK